VPLEGSSVLNICDVSNIIGSASGVYFVTGQPGKVLGPAPVGTISTACVKTIGAEGLIQCGAGAQKTNYTTCQDHNTGGVSNGSGATTSGLCTGVCQASAPNTDPAEDSSIINGGACITLSNTGGTAGDAFINLTSQINLAPPGDTCTNPSTQDVQNPALTALTSGTAQAFVKNADDQGPDSEIASTPATGTGFNCAALQAGQSPGTSLVGAYPSVNALEPAPGVILDSAIGFTLKCSN
jgi:hypothetical protein